MLDAAEPAVRLATQPPAGATMALAGFVAGLRRTGVPAAMRAVLQDAVVDAVGCGLFGLTTPACRIVQDYAAAQGGPPVATLWCSAGHLVSASNAALSIGTSIHGFDFDDGHRAKLHPAAAVLPAALTLAERERADGQTFLAALAAGYEVMVRVGLAANPDASRQRGWRLTGTCGTFGAAAAACVILGLDTEQTASALGLAGSQSSGLWAFNANGAMSKRLHPGLAAQSGVMAAELAQRGFDGPHMILEAPDGGFLAATSDDVRLPEATRDLGTAWRSEALCFKPYACCGSNHACMDAAIGLMHMHGFTAADVARVSVGVSREVARQGGLPYTASTVLNAQMSLRYAVAVVLTDGDALTGQFTPQRIADPAVNNLASRVDVEADPEMDAVYPERSAGIVHVTLHDGRRLTRRVDYPRGTPENRMAPEELRAKFLSLAGAAVGEDSAETVLAVLGGVFDAPDMMPIARMLGGLSLR
jgi:2-methylcitrate dehydratase PrpD